MSFWSKVAGFFTGGTVKAAGEIYDNATFSAEEKAAQDAQDTDSARKYTAPSHGSWFDIIIDGWSRMIRPGITTWLIGGLSGWWKLPTLDKVDPFWYKAFIIVLTFWFGGRAILKDIPKALELIWTIKRRLK